MTMKFNKELIGPQCRLSSHTCSLLGEAARSTGEIRKSPPRWRTTLAWDIEGRGETKLTFSRGASHWTNRKKLFAQWTLRSQSVFRSHWNEKPVVWNSSAFLYSFYIVAVQRTAKKWVKKKGSQFMLYSLILLLGGVPKLSISPWTPRPKENFIIFSSELLIVQVKHTMSIAHVQK